jgi:hypothetical protein
MRLRLLALLLCLLLLVFAWLDPFLTGKAVLKSILGVVLTGTGPQLVEVYDLMRTLP